MTERPTGTTPTHAAWFGIVFDPDNIAWLRTQGHETGRDISRYINQLVTDTRNRNHTTTTGTETSGDPT